MVPWLSAGRTDPSARHAAFSTRAARLICRHSRLFPAMRVRACRRLCLRSEQSEDELLLSSQVAAAKRSPPNESLAIVFADLILPATPALC